MYSSIQRVGIEYHSAECVHSHRDILLNIILVRARPCIYVGVNTCVNVKMRAAAVSTEAAFTVKTPASDTADGVKEV